MLEGNASGRATLPDAPRSLKLCLTLYVTALTLSVGVSYIPPWMLLKFSPGLRLMAKPLAEALLLTYMLSLSAGSIVSGVVLNVMRYGELLLKVGGFGIAATTAFLEALPSLGLPLATACWASLGFFTSLAIFGLSYVLKCCVSAWSRGKTFATGFAAGSFINALSLHLVGVDRILLFLQTLLALLSTALILRNLRAVKKGVLDSIHVRDFRLYLFMIPTLAVAVFVGHLLRGFMFSGIMYMVFSTLRYSPVLALPMLLSIIAGYLMDRYGRRESGAVGSILLSAGVVVLLVHHLSGILEKSNGLSTISFSVIGAGLSFIVPYIVITWVDVPRRALLGRILTLGTLTFAAGVIAGVLATAVTDNIDSTLTAITLSLIPLIYVILKLPETLPLERLLSEDLRRYLRKALEIAEEK